MDETVEPRRTTPSAPASTDATEGKTIGIELLIGSNLFRDTNGVVKIHGKEQLVIETGPEEGSLLITADLYDASGARIAHLRRNVLAVNRTGRFVVETHRTQPDSSADTPWVRLLDRHSREIILDIQAASEQRARIVSARLYSHKGILVEVTAHYCRLGGDMTLFGNIVDSRGSTVVLG